MSNPDTAEAKILAILDEMEFKITGTPKHWEKTPERIAIENEAVSQLKGLLVDARQETQNKLLNIHENVPGLASVNTGEISDGYHTFNELYRYRLLYHASYANLVHFYEQQYGGAEKPVKSWKHSDGELCFGGGWFVVTQQLPTGQITNHYEAKDWDLFNIPEVDTAPEYDGHTPQEAADRLEAALQQTRQEEVRE